MGLWAWMTNQIFTRKFWQGVKKDGLILTYTRGHKAMMHAHAVGGIDGNAKFVGQDEFGNRYYEDLDFIRNAPITQIRTSPDGSSSQTTTEAWEESWETECPRLGTDGWHTLTTTCPQLGLQNS